MDLHAVCDFAHVHQDQLEAQEDANPGLEVESSGVRFRKRLTVFGNLFFCATCVCVVFAVYIHDESGSRQLVLRL